MESIPDQQTAWVVVRRGFPRKALSMKADWPVPKNLESGEVLVKVQAAALNPAGWKFMVVLPNFLAKRPHVAEFDFSGVVVDANSTALSKGDAVYGWVPGDLQRENLQGSLAQYVRVPAVYLVKRPSNITPVEAAGITVCALTAYQAMYHLAEVEPGQTVFINGGSSSLGAFSIQFAKVKGAKVVATASAKNESFVRKMGADEFIDYRKIPLHKYLQEHPPTTKYHVIFDAVGLSDPSLFTYSEKYLAPDGIFISSGPMPRAISMAEAWNVTRTLCAMFIPAWLGGVTRRYSIIFAKNDHEDMEEIQKLLESGTVKPVTDSVFSFEDALQAYDKLMSSKTTGKVIVKVDPTVQ